MPDFLELELKKGDELLHVIKIPKEPKDASLYQYYKGVFAADFAKQYMIDTLEMESAITNYLDNDGNEYSEFSELLGNMDKLKGESVFISKGKDKFDETIYQKVSILDAIDGRYDHMQYTLIVKNLVSSYYEIPEDISGIIPIGNIHGLDEAEADTGRLTLHDLYLRAVGMITTTEPVIRTSGQDCDFEYRGVKFSIPMVMVDAALNRDILPDMTTDQYVRALNLRKYYTGKQQSYKGMTPTKAMKQQNSNSVHAYTLTLYFLSLFVVCEEWDEIPFEQSRGDIEIDRRVKFFNGMDEDGKDVTDPIGAQQGLDAVFFLGLTKPLLKGIKRVNTFLNRLSSEDDQANPTSHTQREAQV